jgi:long-chain acyl-CoA synthetase
VDAAGYLYLHDRLKDMIVSGGENVYPAEVESVMTGHPDVGQVAVIGVPSERWGESPLAVVVRRPGGTVEESDLLAWTRERLAHYKCPVAVAFVDELPLNATGKLLKHRLRSAYADGVS